MKTHKYSVRILLAVFLIGILATISMIVVVDQVTAQGDLISEIKNKLTKQSIPVRQTMVTERLPLKLEIQLQSQTTDELVTPDDPLHIAAVTREVFAARVRGTKVNSFALIIFGQQNQEIYRAYIKVDRALDKVTTLPSKIESSVTTNYFQERLPKGDLTLSSLTIHQNEDGSLRIITNYSSPSIEALNAILPELMGSFSALVQEFESQVGARISGYEVSIFETSNTPLLKYSRDYFPSEARENWWMAEGVTKDWFPHPPDPTTTP